MEIDYNKHQNYKNISKKFYFPQLQSKGIQLIKKSEERKEQLNKSETTKSYFNYSRITHRPSHSMSVIPKMTN